jgi:hypothetical protein
MLDLVRNETERIDSRFLEPACGTGNFLIEVLERKLNTVFQRYGKSKADFERYSFIAVSSLYGIDILEDNIEECKHNLMGTLKKWYKKTAKTGINESYLSSIAHLLDKNIILGDALTLMKIDDSNQPIGFCEWSAVSSVLIKRRDFTLAELLANAPFEEENLFSDIFEDVFIPSPIREFPPIHFLRVGELDAE